MVLIPRRLWTRRETHMHLYLIRQAKAATTEKGVEVESRRPREAEKKAWQSWDNVWDHNMGVLDKPRLKIKFDGKAKRTKHRQVLIRRAKNRNTH